MVSTKYLLRYTNKEKEERKGENKRKEAVPLFLRVVLWWVSIHSQS